MKVRTTKKQIKALKGKFNVGVIYKRALIACGQPNIHKGGIGVELFDDDFEFLPWKVIGGVVGLKKDDFEC